MSRLRLNTEKVDNSTIVCMNLSRVASNYDQRCEFHGDDGELLKINFTPNLKESFPERYATAFAEELNCFVLAVLCDFDAQSQKPTLEECLNNLLIANACEEAVDKRKTVNIQYSRDSRIASKKLYNKYTHPYIL